MKNETLVGLVSTPGGRGTVKLVYGCLSTILLCAWSSLHLNVPPDGEDTCEQYGRRAIWMIITIIFPEYVAVHALREGYEARWWIRRFKSPIREGVRLSHVGLRTNSSSDTALKKSIETESTIPCHTQPVSAPNISSWTLRHAAFAYMGGFDLVFDDGHSYRLNAVQFLILFEDGLIALPTISTQQISALSKSDPFAKTLTCFQLLWLLTYLIARVANHLPITTLELFTVSMVCCTFFMYVGWWSKPKDVEMAISITARGPREDIERILKSYVFYAPNDGIRVSLRNNIHRSITKMRYFLLVTLLPTFTFGACHLLGWNFWFATLVEAVLWRVTSVGCLFLPLLLLGYGFYVEQRKCNEKPNCHEKPKPWRPLPMALLTTIYVSCRIYMLVEMFVGLRQVPADVYADVAWTQYIPHLGG